MQDKENGYVIGDLVMITGLTDRTIRSYIQSGILKGEKINGVWHFLPEQVEEFIRHPSVRSSILAKNNALVYDFLLSAKKTVSEACVILDIPNDDSKAISEFFCRNISSGDYHNLKFSFNSVGQTPRIILKGLPAEVMKLVNLYYSR